MKAEIPFVRHVNRDVALGTNTQIGFQIFYISVTQFVWETRLNEYRPVATGDSKPFSDIPSQMS